VTLFGLDSNSIEQIEQAFGARRKLASAREDRLFSVLSESLSAEEEFALKFLYAHMPLCDLADYDGSLFQNHVRTSLETLQKVPWGTKITGELYLYYILPYRISNEVIEDYRGIFYDWLIDRVRDKSMYDAILEINHWCHEKATYIATDPRTASPLTVVRTALGRCGEESALLVAALRSMCIPARQCYTPRWAHTDSNHAWVEAWADGRWYFLGACEPEPRLDMGWFAGPASRAMLVSTRIPDSYRGPEERVQSFDGYLAINLLSNYAPTRTVTVAVRDGSGRPVEKATVSFNVFNYGGFAPITTLQTDSLGDVRLTTGLGDLFVYAHSRDGYGYRKIAAHTGDRVEITLSDRLPDDLVFELNMTPPPDTYASGQDIAKEELEAHNQRLKDEDRIRAEYEATFVTEEEARKLARELGLDSEGVCAAVKKARGNGREIVSFLRKCVPIYGEWALEILKAVSEKDLTDTTGDTLIDHLEGAMPFRSSYDREVFIQNVLNPRVSLEVLRPYRRFFQEEFSAEQQRQFRDDPRLLADWVAGNIARASDGHFGGYATPRGTYELRVAGAQSRRILFVAMARSFGIAARLSRADQKVQYLSQQGWIDVFLDSGGQSNAVAASSGLVKLNVVGDYDGKIEYARNFTLARFDDYALRTLHLRGTVGDKLDEPLSVPPGYYWLTTGNRLQDGTALVRVRSFRVNCDRLTEVDLMVRQDKELDRGQASQLGSIPQGIVVTGSDGSTSRLDDLVVPSGAVLAWIEPDREPSKHLIRELGELREELDRTGAGIYLFVDEEHYAAFPSESGYGGLPESTRLDFDRAGECLKAVTAGLSSPVQRGLPLVLVVGSDRSIRYVSAGYRLGVGMDVLRRLR
jgi:hypothetical protein